jgi:hypothetical protein
MMTTWGKSASNNDDLEEEIAHRLFCFAKLTLFPVKSLIVINFLPFQKVRCFRLFFSKSVYSAKPGDSTANKFISIAKFIPLHPSSYIFFVGPKNSTKK